MALNNVLRNSLMASRRMNVNYVANSLRFLSSGQPGPQPALDKKEVEMDLGLAEGTLTCSTCHLILKSEDYDSLPDKPTDEELDMLDLAYDLKDTSRLGCQIILSEKMENLEVNVPATVNDARS
ncbi:hypothetical protein NQ317_014415 [Molorchus minor]|uniref:Uncharacterized protein n=1 Tax=Molorchus minor TaxID=1323400 RepID=A0ABQ9K8A7_9CUCU|nr:hypothetical protein NQ317_014415 [Molorchus minor]